MEFKQMLRHRNRVLLLALAPDRAVDFVKRNGFVGPCEFMHACSTRTDLPKLLCY